MKRFVHWLLRREKGEAHQALGLRARVTAAFALGACLLSLSLSISTYVVVRHQLIEQREQLASRQTYVNARLVRSGLRLPKSDVNSVLSTLGNPTGSYTLIHYDGRWFPSNTAVDENFVPQSMRESVNGGQPGKMIFKVNNQPQLAIGIPIPAIGASYFEISGLQELDNTLRSLLFKLAIASIVTTLGGAAMGRWASRLVLRPVTEAASAAQSIAAGDMNARLEPKGDWDLDRLVSSFNSMVDALQARMERDARFASNVSHELRSPLMTLSSGLSVMQGRRDQLPERAQTALDLLAEEIQRFQRMVQDLLEISRADSGHLDVVFDEVFVQEFVTRVCDSFDRPIPIETTYEIANVIISVDKRRMERVLGNLIENADRYARGVTRIVIKASNKTVQIAVDDAGPGVPIEERERIFDRFSRGATARSRASGDGTGLGLSLVDEHVRLHKGKVWVEDSPEGGARFVVEIPRVET